MTASYFSSPTGQCHVIQGGGDGSRGLLCCGGQGDERRSQELLCGVQASGTSRGAVWTGTFGRRGAIRVPGVLPAEQRRNRCRLRKVQLQVRICRNNLFKIIAISPRRLVEIGGMVGATSAASGMTCPLEDVLCRFCLLPFFSRHPCF